MARYVACFDMSAKASRENITMDLQDRSGESLGDGNDPFLSTFTMDQQGVLPGGLAHISTVRQLFRCVLAPRPLLEGA